MNKNFIAGVLLSLAISLVFNGVSFAELNIDATQALPSAAMPKADAAPSAAIEKKATRKKAVKKVKKAAKKADAKVEAPPAK